MSWIGTPLRDCWPTFSLSVSNSAEIAVLAISVLKKLGAFDHSREQHRQTIDRLGIGGRQSRSGVPITTSPI